MKFTALLMLLWLFVGQAVAQNKDSLALQQKRDKESAARPHPLVAYHPTPLPDRILLLPTEGDGGELTITWRTDTSQHNGVVEIEEANGITFADAKKTEISSTYTIVTHKDYPMHYHRAVVKGLRPGATYHTVWVASRIGAVGASINMLVM